MPARPTPYLATRLAALPPSGTLAVGEQVRALRAAGRTVFNLSGGAPDPGPPVGLGGLEIAASENALGDPWGELFLRRAFAERLARRHGVVRVEREMMATIGAKQGVYFAALALLEPGDEVIVIDPCWVTYAPSVALAGGTAVPVPLAPPDNRLDVVAIAAAITPRTRAVLINTPHNPTGRVFTDVELSALADLVKTRDLWLICDESFDLFVFDDGKHVSPGVFDAIRDRTLLLYSFSKAFALPSYRIGMLVGPEPICRLIATCTQQLISSVSLASQKVAAAALQQETDWAPFLRATYQAKRDACLAVLQQDRRIAAPPPQGTFYLFPNIARLGLPSDALTARLLDKAGVAVTSGTVFGAAGEGHIRLNLVGPLPAILDGVQALIPGISDVSVALEIANLNKSFGSLQVLKDVSLTVTAGDVVTVCGASGSGKSTLLRCINGLETPDSGSIRFEGADMPRRRTALRDLRRHIGMVFQSFNLFPHLTALQNVSLGPRKILGKSAAEAREIAHGLLERVGLSDKADAFPDFLSGGQQQRVAIARALAMQPSLMLFDEPTSALDPEMVAEVLDVMRKLADQGMTMIVVSHEMNFAREVADRVAFMHAGAILEAATPDVFFQAPQSEEARRFVRTVLGQQMSVGGRVG